MPGRMPATVPLDLPLLTADGEATGLGAHGPASSGPVSSGPVSDRRPTPDRC
jgi:hypothetical protein